MKGKRLKFSAPLIISEVDAHPDLLSIPTFVLFVQKDELQMSRAEVRKEDRLEAQKEFEQWLSHQTAPRQAPPKKQMQNEESLVAVDDKERSAVAVRTNVQQGGPRGISRPSSDGFRPRAGGAGRPGGPPVGGAAPARAWNSQRGPQRPIDPASPPRSRAMTMADSVAAAAAANHVEDAPSAGLPGPAGRSPTRKSPTPRPGVNGRPKTPTPRPGSSGSAQRRRPPSARKENGIRNGRTPSASGAGGAPPGRPSSSGMGSQRAAPQATAKTPTRKTPRATPRREQKGGGPIPLVAPPGSAPLPIS